MKEKTHVYDPIRKALPRVDWQRIENVAGTGVPDVNGCSVGVEFWFESKIGTSGTFTIRPDQIAWLTRRYNKGGRVFIVLREGNTFSVYKPTGTGQFTLIGNTSKPFNYEWMLDIFLHHPMKSVL